MILDTVMNVYQYADRLNAGNNRDVRNVPLPHHHGVVPRRSRGGLNRTLPCHQPVVTPPTVSVQSIVMSVSVGVSVCLSVCLSVGEYISETTRPNYTKFSAQVSSSGNRGSVLR